MGRAHYVVQYVGPKALHTITQNQLAKGYVGPLALHNTTYLRSK